MITMKEIGTRFANKQQVLVDAITESAPAFSQFLWEQATHKMYNLAEEVVGVKGAGFVKMDEPLPTMQVNTGLKHIDLNILGGKLECGVDTANAYEGGKDAYLAKKLPKLFKDAGQTAEKSIIYEMFRKHALNHGENIIKANTGVAPAGSVYSLLAVRMTEGENNGLYSPASFSQGTVMVVTPKNGGNIYDNHLGQSIYGWEARGYFGWQILNPKTVAMIANIDETNKPTATMLDDLIERIEDGDSGKILLIASTKVRKWINELKGSKLQLTTKDVSLSTRLTDWDGNMLIYTKNMSLETAI